MQFHPTRRRFLQAASALAATTATGLPTLSSAAEETVTPAYKISLAQWSLHRALRDKSKNLTNLDFPRIAKEEFGIDAIEYVNQFFKDKAKDETYLSELKSRCESNGVKSLLIMVDGEGRLGEPDEKKRVEAVNKHKRWVDAAKFLGCHSIRVNAASTGEYDEQQKLAADGLRRLSEYAAPHGINVIVENHGGLSSNGEWLAQTIEMVGLENCGTLPDFGNFWISRKDPAEWFDNYKGVDLLMPFAKAVSAKTYEFKEGTNTTFRKDQHGNYSEIDYDKMMHIVLAHGYHGYVGIEYEGAGDEFEGIRKSKEVLERLAKTVGLSAATSG